VFDRFKKKKNSENVFSTMAPMADIVFLLLIFFMLTSAFVMEPGIDINLPRALTAEDQERREVVLTITGDRTLLLNEDVVSFDELKNALERKFADAGDKGLLIVRADEGVPHGLVVRSLDISRQAGVSQLAIATERLQD